MGTKAVQGCASLVVADSVSLFASYSGPHSTCFLAADAQAVSVLAAHVGKIPIPKFESMCIG